MSKPPRTRATKNSPPVKAIFARRASGASEVAKPTGGKPGRPRGLGKVQGSGRQRGTPNKDRSATVERIQKLADPIGFLCDVVRGVRMSGAAVPGDKAKTWWVPSGPERISAAQTLARKIMPDQKAVEVSGPVGEPMVIRINLGSPA